MALALLVAPFLLYYLAAMFPNFSTHYANQFRLPLAEVLASYLKVDLLVWALVAVALAKIFLILWDKVAPSPFWDGLALAGVGYFAGYLALHAQTAYFLAPSDLIAVLYLGRLAILSMENMGLDRCAPWLYCLWFCCKTSPFPRSVCMRERMSSTQRLR